MMTKELMNRKKFWKALKPLRALTWEALSLGNNRHVAGFLRTSAVWGMNSISKTKPLAILRNAGAWTRQLPITLQQCPKEGLGRRVLRNPLYL